MFIDSDSFKTNDCREAVPLRMLPTDGWTVSNTNSLCPVRWRVIRHYLRISSPWHLRLLSILHGDTLLALYDDDDDEHRIFFTRDSIML